MKYNLIKIMIELGYTTKGAKGVITKKRGELDLPIDNYEQVSRRHVIKILDTIKNKGMASLVMKINDFLYSDGFREELNSKYKPNSFKPLKPLF